jgi:hypothetical protein
MPVGNGEARRSFRMVVFNSRRARAVWAAAGGVSLIAGFLLAAPTFQHATDSPEPWALWLGADGVYAPPPSVGRLLSLDVAAENGCDGPVTVTGRMEWSASDRWLIRHSYDDLVPRRLVLGVAGVKVLRAEVRDFESASWRRASIKPYQGISVVDSRVDGSSLGQPDVRFRLSVASISPAGFEACSTTSPAILEYKGGEPQIERVTRAWGYLEQNQLLGNEGIHEFPVSDGLVWMSVEGHQPDRGLLDRSSNVVANRVLVTCTSATPTAPSIPRQDPFSYYRQDLEESSCGSVQTFRAAGAPETLNERVFFAGILVSAGVTLLLEALLTGKTVRRRDGFGDGGKPIA